MEALVPWWGILPFVAMLLCIALLPLIPATSHRWEDWRFQLALALCLGVPVATWMGIQLGWGHVGHTVVEYLQFICLLFALFCISGGLYLGGDIRPTPRNNTIALAIGAALASFIGTTGAAMLLIRPILGMNKLRTKKVHTIVFTILIVANNGGLLTPLGDPPLFMGFLRGVPFTWTFKLLPMWLFINAMLLVAYYALDTKAISQEKSKTIWVDDPNRAPVYVKGLINLLWLVVVVLGVALVPSIDLHAVETGHALWHHYVPWREVLFLSAVAGSFVTSRYDVRYELNQFNWGPIREVAVIFIGIFLTMIPALAFLGQVAHEMPLNTITFFVFTGVLSAFLDNAPTYATFFELGHTLGTDPTIMPGEPRIAGVPEIWLEAISLAAVTCGAITYIGNGPNFMVKSVADASGVKMPDFGGYIGWTVRHLAPILVALVFIFLGGSTMTLAIGVAISIGLLALNVRTIVRYRRPRQEPSEATSAPTES